MHRRAAAAEIVIVHGGQVVVDEGVAVDAFERRGGAERVGHRHREQPRRFDDDEGAEPFAAAERGVAHGGEQAGRPGDLAGKRLVGEELVEYRLGGVLRRLQPGVEVFGHGGPRMVRKRQGVKARVEAGARRGRLRRPGTAAMPGG